MQIVRIERRQLLPEGALSTAADAPLVEATVSGPAKREVRAEGFRPAKRESAPPEIADGRAFKRGRRLMERSDKERHELSIALKDFRHGLEFDLSPLRHSRRV